MAFELNKESYTGGIKEISIGKGDAALTVGGETCYPFYTFEGDMPNKPIIAMEIWDMEPEDWPEAAVAPFKDVISDPAAWAKKCVEEYGAQAIVLQLKSVDPNDKDASAASAAETAKKVKAAIDVPLIVWGCANPEKDEEVFKAICEACDSENLLMGPVEEKNYKGIAAAAMGYNHSLISSSPIDVNLAKQINILLENFGMPMERVIVDPTTGGLGYGLEYSYSVMERLSMAAMTQGDDKLQYPMINNLGNEVWKCKEAKQTVEDAPLLGDPERRGILMEAVGAVSYLLSGTNILIMRHPEAIRLAKAYIDLMMDGGSAADIIQLAQPATINRYGAEGLIQEIGDVIGNPEKLVAEQPVLDAYTDADGNIWAIPYQVGTKSHVWYPIKAFEAAGYEVPTTWDELIALSDQIVADDLATLIDIPVLNLGREGILASLEDDVGTSSVRRHSTSQARIASAALQFDPLAGQT